MLSRDFLEDFVQKMRNRIVVSHYKYGWMKDTYPEGWQKLPPQYIRFASKHQAYIAVDPDTGEVDTTNWNDPTIQRMVKDGVIIN